MTTRRWWGAPVQLGDAAPLQRLDTLFSPDEPVFTAAQPLTVRVRGIMIREDMDWSFRGDNDIAVVTTFQFGAEPPVQRLHYMKNSVPLGWQGAFFHDTVLSLRDLTDSILTLRLQIYDMDGVSEALVQQITDAANSVAVAFPQLARYAGALAMLAPGLVGLVDNLDAHDQILDQRLKLELDEPGTGHALLQPGYFVCFKDPHEQELSLNADLRVVDADGNEYTAASYAVLEVARAFHEHYEWEIDQRIAKLIAELEGKGQSGKAAIEFLRQTLTAYSRFRRLERAQELKSKPSRSPAEQDLLDELTQDPSLSPFLTGKL
ncbi:hypothetical protein [Haliangium sp.]|uniref:hypothetical protein n=1 Tax=Haliangium sp. TaxID=2663208 RepID=UPI003D0A77AB